jgi:hypothetical protein
MGVHECAPGSWEDAMTEEPGSPWSAGGAAFEPIASFLRDAVKAQEDAMSQAQTWSVNVMAAYREQADEFNAMLQAVNRSLLAMEELVQSQTKATRALGESLEASRQLVDTAVTSNQRSLERLESLVKGMVDQVGGQLQALGHETPTTGSVESGPLAAPNEAYLTMARAWMDAFNSFLGGTGGKRPDPGTAEGP